MRRALSLHALLTVCIKGFLWEMEGEIKGGGGCSREGEVGGEGVHYRVWQIICLGIRPALHLLPVAKFLVPIWGIYILYTLVVESGIEFSYRPASQCIAWRACTITLCQS